MKCLFRELAHKGMCVSACAYVCTCLHVCMHVFVCMCVGGGVQY